MALIEYHEQLREYKVERDKQVEVAGGRLAVSYALRHHPDRISFVRTDVPSLMSVNAGHDLGVHDYAIKFHSLEDVFDLGPSAILGLLPEVARQRTDYWWIRNLLALREPTLPILVDSVAADHPYTPTYDIETISNLRAGTYISSLASAALYHESNGMPVVGQASILHMATPAPVAA